MVYLDLFLSTAPIYIYLDIAPDDVARWLQYTHGRYFLHVPVDTHMHYPLEQGHFF